MTGAQALVRSLVREGVEVVFALPGVQVMDAFDALYDEPGIRLVVPRHEQGVVYMADGYARTTGKVGVGLVVPGPGALNAAGALGTAYSASSPVMLISGQARTYEINSGVGVLHEVDDQLDAFRPITKWVHRVMSVGEVPDGVHAAMEQLQTGRPRPVEFEVPWDVLTSTSDVELAETEVFTRQGPDPADIRNAAELLASAHHPLIWAGSGVMLSDASPDLLELATALNAPVITTPEGKGAIPESNPLSLGSFYYAHGPSLRAMPQADVILVVGSRAHVLMPRPSWAFQPHQKIVQIDVDPQEVGRNLSLEIGIASDARLALRELLGYLGGPRHASQWSAAQLASIKSDAAEQVRGSAPLQSEMLDVVRQELDDDAIVVAGVTDMGYWAHLGFPVHQTRSYLTSSYFATLGFALPTAIGAKIGNPHRQVVALCGDGGFTYASNELATAAQEGANVVALLFNNGAFGASLTEQRDRLQGRYIGTTLPSVDYQGLAQSLGAKGMKLSSPQELRDALRDALRQDGPVVVEIPIPLHKPPFQVPAPTP